MIQIPSQEISYVSHPQGGFRVYWPRDIRASQVVTVLLQFLGTHLDITGLSRWNVPVVPVLGNYSRLDSNDIGLPQFTYVTFERIK